MSGDRGAVEDAQRVYDAFLDHGGSLDGRQLPAWHNLSDRNREAWRAATAVIQRNADRRDRFKQFADRILG